MKSKWMLVLGALLMTMMAMIPSIATATGDSTIKTHLPDALYITADEATAGTPQTLYLWSTEKVVRIAGKTEGASTITVKVAGLGTEILSLVPPSQAEIDANPEKAGTASKSVNMAGAHCMALEITATPPSGNIMADQLLGTLYFQYENGLTTACQVEIRYNSSTNTPRVAPDQVTPQSNTAEMIVGDTLLIPVTVSSTSGTAVDSTLKWASDNEGVVSVNEDTGMMQAKSPGEATITVSSSVTPTVSSQITVTAYSKENDKITVGESRIYLQPGAEKNVASLLTPAVGKQVEYTVGYALPAAEDKLTLKQEDAALTDGKITYDQNGTATITIALAADFEAAWADEVGKIGTITIGDARSQKGTIDVYFGQATEDLTAINKIILGQSELTLVKGNTAVIHKEIQPADALKTAVKWYSSQPETVSVDQNGVITALQPGEATITVEAVDPYAEGQYARTSLLVKVLAAPVYVVESDANVVYLSPTLDNTLHLTLTPAPGSNKMVPLSVNGEYADKLQLLNAQNNPIVLVDGAGEMAFSEAGQGILTLSLPNGALTELVDGTILAEITVGGAGCQPAVITIRYQASSKPLTQILLQDGDKNIKMRVGDTRQITPVLKPNDATDRSVKWEVSAGSDVVSVEEGLITALKPGKATVTVTAVNPYDAITGALAKASLNVEVYELLDEDTAFEVSDRDSGTKVTVGNGEKIAISGVQIKDLKLINGVDLEGNEEIIWSSTKNTVATIEASLTNGEAVLTTIRPGTTTIKAKGAVSGQLYSFDLEVVAVAANGVEIHYDDHGVDVNITNAVLPPIAKGRTLQLEARLLPTTATPVKVTWSSSNTKVATITSNGGLLKVRADEGTTIITATAKIDGGTVKAQTTFNANATEPFKEITVWRVDAAGNPSQPSGTSALQDMGAELVTTSSDGSKTTFNNATAPNSPLLFDTGTVHYFRIRGGAAASLTTDGEIKWITPLSGLVTVKVTAIDGSDDTLMKVTVTNTAKKAAEGQLARIVASNVGNYQNENDPNYENYPEILIQLKAQAPDAIAITGVPKLMQIGETKTLKVKTTPSNRDAVVKWQVSATSPANVISIDENTGAVTALGMGTATVEAVLRQNENIKATAEIVVDYKVSSLKLNATRITLSGDEEFTLEVSAQPYNVLLDPANVTFKSRDPYIAEVTDQGVVKLYSPGTAQKKEYTYIDVWVNDQKKLSCKVTVGESIGTPDLSGVTVSSKLAVNADNQHVLTLSSGGKSKQLSYVVNGLTTEQKKRVMVDWRYKGIENGADNILGEEIIYIDDLGFVSRVTAPKYNMAKVEATFYYGSGRTEADKIGELVYLVQLESELTVSVDNGTFVDKPAVISSLNVVDGTCTVIVNVAPPGDNVTAEGLELKETKAFAKYLSCQEDSTVPVAAGQVAYQVTLKALPNKVTSVSMTISDGTDKVTLKFKLPAATN